jgi:hypothetical protein
MPIFILGVETSRAFGDLGAGAGEIRKMNVLPLKDNPARVPAHGPFDGARTSNPRYGRAYQGHDRKAGGGDHADHDNATEIYRDLYRTQRYGGGDG